MSDITEQVGALIRETRKQKGLTQKEMGEKLGISESAYNRYEAGKQNLTLDTFKKVTDALGVNLKITFD